jgi:4-hydroxyphenylpyruvate dioxygenase
MRTAIATVCLSGTLPEKIDAIAEAKFKGIEIFENDLLSFNGTPRDARRMIEGRGLETVTFQPFRDFEGMPEPLRAKVFARAERKFDIMQELGCDLLMVCSNVSPEALGGVDRAAADFRELAERAARRGMRVGFEALSWGRHIHDYRDAWEVVRRADHAALGLVLDSFHVLARGTDLAAIRAIPEDRIFLVQMADAPKLQMDYLSWSRHYRCFPGQGDLPINDFMLALHETGFDGLLSLEIFNDRFRAGSARSVAVDGQRSLVVMLDELRQRTGTASAGLPRLPPKVRCSGIEFIEFATDERAKVSLQKTLADLGFRKAGLHRSKDVTRWRQGDVNIVVNAENEGFAHSFNIVHGTSVCALALRVDDAQRAVERALTLLDQPFQQPVGPGEMNIPAVRGLGGSLLYFVDHGSGLDRLWDVDFEPVATDQAPEAGIGTVDHISQSMHYEEMLTWLLFYTSLLEARKTPLQTVVDPGGIVQSQVVEASSGLLRLVLNASQSQQTQSSRFLNEFFGSGVQHIAFGTTDIFSTVERLKANGVGVLSIPENYYDDLEVRMDLPADAIARLRTGDVLYDRDGNAEYFQVYTRAIDGGLFFEIVERRSYAGFGAVNAPIRLAAQSELSRVNVYSAA